MADKAIAIDPTEDNNIDKSAFIALLELQEKYQIGRDPLYVRMRYLAITTWKIGGKAYLDEQQIAYMDELHEHIKTVGRMEGYTPPAPSGPVTEAKPSAAIQTVEESREIEVAVNSVNYSPQNNRAHSSGENEAIASLIQSAQNKAAGVLIAENVLAQQFIQNPDALPPELKAKIKESSQMPTVDPFAYAASLMNFAASFGVAA